MTELHMPRSMSIACWWSVSLLSRSSYFSEPSQSATDGSFMLWCSWCCSTNSSQISPRLSRGTPTYEHQTYNKHGTALLSTDRWYGTGYPLRSLHLTLLTLTHRLETYLFQQWLCRHSRFQQHCLVPLWFWCPLYIIRLTLHNLV